MLVRIRPIRTKWRRCVANYLLRATCAAMTLCRSTTSRQLAQWQSRQRQWRLWPFRHDTTPWLRHRAHFGVLSNRLDDDNDDDDDDAVEPAPVAGRTRSVSFDPQRRSGSSSEQPSMSRYSSDASPSETASVKHLMSAIVELSATPSTRS